MSRKSFPQMDWLPGTHRLLYSSWTYLVQAEGKSHATPRGLYLVDADSRTDTVMLYAENFRSQLYNAKSRLRMPVSMLKRSLSVIAFIRSSVIAACLSGKNAT